MRNSSDRFVNKIETRVLCSQIFFRESYRLWRNMEKYGTARAATDDNIIRSNLHADNYDKNTDTHSWYFVLIIVNSCTICFVVRQQSKDNLLLNFHRNSEHILLTATSTPNAIKRGLFLRFRGNNDYANAPQCNVVRTSSCSHSVSAVPLHFELSALSVLQRLITAWRKQRWASHRLFCFPVQADIVTTRRSVDANTLRRLQWYIISMFLIFILLTSPQLYSFYFVFS